VGNFLAEDSTGALKIQNPHLPNGTLYAAESWSPGEDFKKHILSHFLQAPT